nr:protein UXT homolog [Tanacetum cinerariifolium]
MFLFVENKNKTFDPILAKHLKHVKQGGKGEIALNHKDEDDYDGLPYQIFWFPAKNKEMENDMKENNVDLVADKGVPDEKKLLRLKKHDSSNGETKSDTSTDDVKKVDEDRLADPYEDAAKGKKTQSGKEMARKEENKLLSKHEAALIIQCVYHSFKGSKSQPLTKLRQINEVRKQVANLVLQTKQQQPHSRSRQGGALRGRMDKVFEQQKVLYPFVTPFRFLEKFREFRENSVTSLRSMINLGSEVYAQADVIDLKLRNHRIQDLESSSPAIHIDDKINDHQKDHNEPPY